MQPSSDKGEENFLIYLQLFLEFAKISVVCVGGGYASMPLIQAAVVDGYHWLSLGEFIDIFTISQMTPGPIGINSATYCGYAAVHNAGFNGAMAVLGSFTATFALVLPSLILMILISKLFMKYMDTPVVQNIFTALRPVVVGLLAAATLLLVNDENFSTPKVNPWQFWISVGLFVATFVGTKWVKINPIKMICFAAFAGLILLY